MKLIAAVDNNWAIGKNNELLVRIPEDQKYFRNTTLNKVVVMGRKTLESFPNARPLPKRVNIVLTRRMDYHPEGVIVVHDIDELKTVLADYNDDDVFIIGGDSIYHQLADLCDTAYITKVNMEYDADAYFPNLDEDASWKAAACSEEQTYYDIEYFFMTYKRV